MHFKRHLAFTLAGLILCIGWFAFTQTDLRLQGLFFDIPHQQWMWNRDDPIKQLLLYDGPKYILVGFAVCLALAGRFLAQRRRYYYCLVMAGIACMFMPFGTVLGVFTIIVLLRESVKELFGEGEAAAVQTGEASDTGG